MWKKFLELTQDLFALRHQVKAHDKRLDELSQSTQDLFKDSIKVSERMLKMEIELQQSKAQQAMELERLKEQQAAEREIFRLQLENTMMRMQRGLPPRDPDAPPDEDEK